jgi:hypothetical protein
MLGEDMYSILDDNQRVEGTYCLHLRVEVSPVGILGFSEMAVGNRYETRRCHNQGYWARESGVKLDTQELRALEVRMNAAAQDDTE